MADIGKGLFMKGLIKGFWETATLICGNHPGEEVEMTVKSGPTSLFYACPRYDADKRPSGEPPCLNRISLKEFEGMLDDIFELLTGDDAVSTLLNLTNHSWTRKGIEYKVLLHTDKQIRIQVLNRRSAMRR